MGEEKGRRIPNWMKSTNKKKRPPGNGTGKAVPDSNLEENLRMHPTGEERRDETQTQDEKKKKKKGGRGGAEDSRPPNNKTMWANESRSVSRIEARPAAALFHRGKKKDPGRDKEAPRGVYAPRGKDRAWAPPSKGASTMSRPGR